MLLKVSRENIDDGRIVNFKQILQVFSDKVNDALIIANGGTTFTVVDTIEKLLLDADNILKVRI